MHPNPDKTPRSHRGSDAPICSVHARRPFEAAGDRRPGAQPDNDNALLHGFHGRFLRAAAGQPLEDVGDLSLIGEIAISRLVAVSHHVGDRASAFEQILDEILDELCGQWGVPL